MSDIKDDFERNGCSVIKQFASEEEIKAMKNRALELVGNWDGASTVFRTDDGQLGAQGSDDYFLSSACEIRFFWENESNCKKGRTPQETLAKINKIGHGLHEADPVFRKYAHSEKVSKLVRHLGWKDPVLPQSMYILKNPKIGGEVTAHQDSSFLYTQPKQSCLGLWLALDEANLENGCLWYRPGSHKEPVRRHFYRTTNPKTGQVEMDFKQLVDDSQLSYFEGKALTEEDQSKLKSHGFIPVHCSPGDLVLIHGQVEHLSLPNRSSKQRHTFQLHLVEGENEGITWSPNNWLQYPAGKLFAKL